MSQKKEVIRPEYDNAEANIGTGNSQYTGGIDPSKLPPRGEYAMVAPLNEDNAGYEETPVNKVNLNEDNDGNAEYEKIPGDLGDSSVTKIRPPLLPARNNSVQYEKIPDLNVNPEDALGKKWDVWDTVQSVFIGLLALLGVSVLVLAAIYAAIPAAIPLLIIGGVCLITAVGMGLVMYYQKGSAPAKNIKFHGSFENPQYGSDNANERDGPSKRVDVGPVNAGDPNIEGQRDAIANATYGAVEGKVVEEEVEEQEEEVLYHVATQGSGVHIYEEASPGGAKYMDPLGDPMYNEDPLGDPMYDEANRSTVYSLAGGNGSMVGESTDGSAVQAATSQLANAEDREITRVNSDATPSSLFDSDGIDIEFKMDEINLTEGSESDIAGIVKSASKIAIEGLKSGLNLQDLDQETNLRFLGRAQEAYHHKKVGTLGNTEDKEELQRQLEELNRQFCDGVMNIVSANPANFSAKLDDSNSKVCITKYEHKVSDTPRARS